MSVLVTGGAGYIGSHVVYALLDAGERVVVVDDLSTGVPENLPDVPLVVGKAGDGALIAKVIREHDVDAVMHFAGSIIVPESVVDPIKYYRNNTTQSLELLAACVETGVESFVFSSTAAVYGEPTQIPVAESVAKVPINPYGESKLMVEHLLRDISASSSLRHVALRYFNVAGADPSGRTGQSTPNATHLIKLAVQAALGLRDSLQVFGTDYPTPDGTCIRDYIHVSDLASAHVSALRYLREGKASTTLNCGYGRGFSVREVLDTVKKVTGVDFTTNDTERREGDPAELVSDANAIHSTFDWNPCHQELEQIVANAYAWESKISA